MNNKRKNLPKRKSEVIQEGKLKVSRSKMNNDIQALIAEGNSFMQTNLTFNEAYTRWMYKIENMLRFSFDYPEMFLKEYKELGGVAFMTPDMDGERILKDGLIVQVAFLEDLLGRLPAIPSNVE